MRKINTGDVFKMAYLLKDAELTQVIKDAYKEGKKEGVSTEQLGMETIMNIVYHCSEKKVEMQFYDILAGITEKPAADIPEQSLETTVADIKRICEENNIINFLKAASGLRIGT